ncbi:IS110 family transposase [Xenorhabdus bovienii]|uniref:IS110 family transposase n=1 Tax=Xenorhabdus bovienii TaxID=40576 RepID=UPI0023B270D0|nr:IS110 family transposase [Xenorhabdus bovienii]MDE9564386.1 IS110 family transposase [Xenorhabdus bovienii]
MKFTPFGVDIAKHLMQIHFIDEYTGELIDKQLRQNDFLTFFSNRQPCLIGMEACGGAHYWARELRKLGHEVRLLQARFVRAFRMGNKNDIQDTRAIWLAVQQPGKSVSVKNEKQQVILSLHRMRYQLVKFRTSQINALHGLLLEFGETVHKGRASLDKAMPEVFERLRGKLAPFLLGLLEEQYHRLNEIDEQIEQVEKQLIAWAKQNTDCQRIMKIPCIGVLIAIATIATMGDSSAFRSGREFSAYLGLVPKQTGTGCRVKLLGISKRGDTYLRTLFIHGARVATLLTKTPLPWVTELKKRRPVCVAIVGMANKLARTVWVLVAHQREYQKDYVSVRPY